jgi:hypothetical protein
MNDRMPLNPINPTSLMSVVVVAAAVVEEDVGTVVAFLFLLLS